MWFNEKQRFALCIGFAAIIVMALFPPTTRHVKDTVERGRLSLSPPTEYEYDQVHYGWLFESGGNGLDVARLLLQFIAVAAGTSIALIVLWGGAGRAPTRPPESDHQIVTDSVRPDLAPNSGHVPALGDVVRISGHVGADRG